MSDTIFDLFPSATGSRFGRRQKRERGSRLPVIIVTGYSSESSAIQAVNLGVVGYLVKPFRIPQILSAVAKALGEQD